jgi:ethanolamine phosphate phosphodiesterase
MTLSIDSEPAILFTHIPLSRPDTASCGNLREHGTIRRGAGPGYQNMFGKLTTQFLLDTVKPNLVLRYVHVPLCLLDVSFSMIRSGDDRDYCEYTHTLPSEHNAHNTSVREVTIKSFSPDKNIRNPGFHMLSLIPPHQVLSNDSPSTTFADVPCFLPSQDRIYTSVYLPSAILTFLILLTHQLLHRRARPHQSPLPSYQLENDRASSSSGLSRRSMGPGSHYEDIRKGLSLQRKRSFRRSGPTPSPALQQPSSTGSAVSRLQGTLKRVVEFADVPVYLSTAPAKPWRVACRVLELAVLDFARVVWPAAIFWSVTMWYILR